MNVNVYGWLVPEEPDQVLLEEREHADQQDTRRDLADPLEERGESAGRQGGPLAVVPDEHESGEVRVPGESEEGERAEGNGAVRAEAGAEAVTASEDEVVAVAVPPAFSF